MKSIFDQRTDYVLNHPLEFENLDENPFKEFRAWYEIALARIKKDPNAMILSTYDGETPRGRVVLLKELDDKGFVYFTNYESDKVLEGNQHPKASLTFFWSDLERQVRVEGEIQKTSPEESDAYFLSRPLGSRLGAWASPQSREIESREWLENKVNEYKTKFKNGESEVIRPSHWGGLRLIPSRFEFWQGQSSRLHDRIVYELESGIWKKKRLAP
jgi:pyridoxamine 5'-phosphate oxidase